MGHRDDVALKGAIKDAPPALVDKKGRLVVIFRVLVCLDHHPRGCPGDSLPTLSEDSCLSGERCGTHQVEDLPLDDEDVKSVHDFLGRRGVLPIMHVEDVDVQLA
jgi:hypothetical protein